MNLSERNRLKVKELVLFAMLGATMFVSKVLLEVLPNVHLLATFITVYTVAFRKKALIPIYVFVCLCGLWFGFSMWWIPYLYIWTILWAVVMLLPQKMSIKVSVVVYCTVCGLHGLLYGTMYAPAQALMFGYDFKQTFAWIAVGFPWDVVHAVGNVVAGLLVCPLVRVIRRIYE